MNRIEAEYVPGSEEARFSGQGDVICPACGKRVCETELGTTEEEGSERAIEICDDCLSEAERELSIEIDADVLPVEKFERLWEYLMPIVLERRASEPPASVAQLAQMLGGQVWHSGGGIFLVLVRRRDGHLIAISFECVSEYASEDALASGQTVNSIRLI